MKKHFDFSYSVFKENEVSEIGQVTVPVSDDEIKIIADALITNGGYMSDVKEFDQLANKIWKAANRDFIVNNKEEDLDWDVYSVEINQKLPLELCIEVYRFILRDELK